MKRKTARLDQPQLPGVDIQRQPELRFSADHKSTIAKEIGPPNLGRAVKVSVPNFSDPNRPKTCLEVDFPIVPINALSRLEGNAGKPIYQMSKWWARRRSSVFRAMLLAAAMEAPIKRHADGSAVLDADGTPVPDETEAAKAVWDVYYANHQKAENFKDLRVLDCFMGGGTTLVEGSRLGFQVSGVDLNPVAWFVVKNELACTDPQETNLFFNQIEAEVKPLIQPFYATECPRGHRGRWFRKAEDNSGCEEFMPSDFDPLALTPETRNSYRYDGPEVVYTFWAKHGPCSKPGCGHLTPIFRTPVIAEKELGTKYLELTCKSCKTAFHAELGSSRMAPAAERIVLDTESPFTELSQAFAKRMLDYSKGSAVECLVRAKELASMVDSEEGLRCPICHSFAGEFLRDVLAMHSAALRRSQIDKKDLNIQPAENGTKSVYSYLLIDPEWLKGNRWTDSSAESLGSKAHTHSDTYHWHNLRLDKLDVIEVRGRIRLADDSSQADGSSSSLELEIESLESEAEDFEQAEGSSEDRKAYGLPQFIKLASGRVISTRKGVIPQNSHFTCAKCGQLQDFRSSIQRFGELSPSSPYALQGSCPQCKEEGYVYGGRFFAKPSKLDILRLDAAETEWKRERHGSLSSYWPKDEIPHTYMTHHANFALPKQGYTHWWKMFNNRQLLVLSLLLRSINSRPSGDAVMHQALGGFQQYLRNQNMFCIWDLSRDCMAPLLSNPNFAPKALTIENSVFGELGRGNWSSTTAKILDGLEWGYSPWEPVTGEFRVSKKDKPRIATFDPILPGSKIYCTSSSDIADVAEGQIDCVITDPPFGDNIFYSDLANFFYAWLRLPLEREFPDLFGAKQTPNAQEAIAPRLLAEEEANDYYKVRLTACWSEAYRILKDGGILAFTFHHSEDSQWAIVLESLFEAGFMLEQTFPIASDEQKGQGGQFGAKGTEYDIIHVCRKRLSDPVPVSWAKMRQWVKAELKRLRSLLDSYRENKISDADIRVILRGKALEFYSRHYGKVLTAADEPMPLVHALAGINQLLDEGSGDAAVLPPSVVQPVAYQYLRLFTTRDSRGTNDVSKSLFGTALRQRDLADRGWIEERNKIVYAVPISMRFEHHRNRPRKEMKAEIDQAHFLIGAAMPNSGINLEEELSKDTWMLRKSVDAVLEWYSRMAPDLSVRNAAMLSRTILRSSVARLRERPGALEEQLSLFNDWDDSDS